MQQERGLKGGEDMIGCPRGLQDRRMKPQAEQPQKCPRCDSLNTKFCYYNNYSLSQPRYFCKTCRRYWTKGGTLRNVPVGGGCRKGKRSKRASSDLSNSSSSFQDKDVAGTTTSSPARNEGLMSMSGEDASSIVPTGSVYYGGDHSGFNSYSTAARIQLMVDHQLSGSSGGDDNKLSILPSLAAFHSFNERAINVGDYSCIFDPRGGGHSHGHSHPPTPLSEGFQSPPFNLPIVQGLNNGPPDHWRLQQEATKFSPASQQQQQHPPPHIDRDGPLHLLSVEESVIQGLRNQRKLSDLVSGAVAGTDAGSSLKQPRETSKSHQEWFVQGPSEQLFHQSNSAQDEATAAAVYWNNNRSTGSSSHWPPTDLTSYGPSSTSL